MELTDERLHAYRESADTGAPVVMINLLRYRERVQHVSLPRPSNPAGLEVPIASA